MIEPLHHKKGISEVLSYVLLVVIAVTVSTLVFTYLKLYIPKGEVPECPTDISVIVQDYSCINGDIKIDLVNKGLFNVDSIYIRIGKEGRQTRQLVDNHYITNGLMPQANITLTYNVIDIVNTGTYILEVEPAIFTGKRKSGYPGNKELALCEKAVIDQNIECS